MYLTFKITNSATGWLALQYIWPDQGGKSSVTTSRFREILGPRTFRGLQ